MAHADLLADQYLGSGLHVIKLLAMQLRYRSSTTANDAHQNLMYLGRPLTSRRKKNRMENLAVAQCQDPRSIKKGERTAPYLPTMLSRIGASGCRTH